MARQESIISTVQAYAETLLADMGLDLVEVEYRREGHGWVLRLYIDREGGVSLDDCAEVSRAIGAFLEVEDIIEHAYHLEVSSPGLERPLRKRKDFVRAIGRKARVKMREARNGQRVFIGTIAQVEGEAVVLLADGVEQVLDLSGVDKARLSL